METSMNIYVIEAVAQNSPKSFYHKWNTEFRHHPDIKANTTQCCIKQALTPEAWCNEINDFLNWYKELLLPKDDFVVLCLSVHGAPNRHEIIVENSNMSIWGAMGQLHKQLQKDVVVLISSCWGAFPCISRFMNLHTRGPIFLFGPTMEVNITALHRAEKEVFKFLATGGFGKSEEARKLVDKINAYGKRSPHKEHDLFYRVWYFDGESIKRYPCYLNINTLTKK